MASESDIIQRESGGDPYVGYTPPGQRKVSLKNAPLNQFGFPIWEGNMGPAGISHAPVSMGSSPEHGSREPVRSA